LREAALANKERKKADEDTLGRDRIDRGRRKGMMDETQIGFAAHDRRDFKGRGWESSGEPPHTTCGG